MSKKVANANKIYVYNALSTKTSLGPQPKGKALANTTGIYIEFMVQSRLSHQYQKGSSNDTLRRTWQLLAITLR
jgi:hypothetical protein